MFVQCLEIKTELAKMKIRCEASNTCFIKIKPLSRTDMGSKLNTLLCIDRWCRQIRPCGESYNFSSFFYLNGKRMSRVQSNAGLNRFHLSQYKSFENTVGKGEIARNEQFLHFRQGFSYPFEELSSFFNKFETVVCKLFQFGRVQTLSFGKRQMHLHKVSIQVSLHRLCRLCVETFMLR